MGFNSKYTGAQVEAWLDNIKNYSANDILEKLKTVDGSNSGLDADLLDGCHSTDFTKTIAVNEDNFLNYTKQARFQTSYLTDGQGDFCSLVIPTWYANAAHNWYLSELRFGISGSVKFRTSHNGSVTNDWKDVAFTDSNVASATKLKTPRTIWGQNFNGTENINGDIIPDKHKVHYIGNASNAFFGMYTLGVWGPNDTSLTLGANNTNHIRILSNGNVGIGIMSPSYPLDVKGDIHTNGTLIQDSDIRLKSINKDILLSIEDIANAPLFEFTYKSDENKRIHVGTSAQYWVEKNNWFCKKQDNGYYDMEIQNLALASAISIAKEFKSYKEETESTISNMKKEIEELKQLILNMNK